MSNSVTLYEKNDWVIFTYIEKPRYADLVELYYKPLESKDKQECWTARTTSDNDSAKQRVPKEVREIFHFWRNMFHE